MENTTGVRITKRDYQFAVAAGLLIGLLLLPVLKTAKPDLYEKFALAIVPFFLLGTPLGLRIAFFIGKKIAIVYQIAKFGLIGVLNTLVDLGVLALVTLLFSAYFQIEAKDVFIGTITFYSLYKSFSFIVANISSYFWNKYWTFDQGAKKQTKSEFVQFFAVSIVGFLINVTVASMVFGALKGAKINASDLQLGQFGLLGAAAGSIAGLAWNFIGYKLWVFKK
jgi:putative flippase GtrA